MGGKRPDQHNIDPAEAGATDYKSLPQTGRGNSNLDDTIELDRQKHAQSRSEEEDRPVPGDKPQPSRDANRGLKADEIRRQLDEHEPGAAQTRQDKENPLV